MKHWEVEHNEQHLRIEWNGTSNFKSDWIADAMQWGKMNRAEAEDYWDKQEYRDS